MTPECTARSADPLCWLLGSDLKDLVDNRDLGGVVCKQPTWDSIRSTRPPLRTTTLLVRRYE